MFTSSINATVEWTTVCTVLYTVYVDFRYISNRGVDYWLYTYGLAQLSDHGPAAAFLSEIQVRVLYWKGCVYLGEGVLYMKGSLQERVCVSRRRCSVLLSVCISRGRCSV